MRRHRLQSVSIGFICFVGMALTALAVTVFLRSTAPWEDAFKATDGAHLTMTLDAGVVTPAQVEATATVPGVAALGDVQETVTLPVGQGDVRRSLQIVGRAEPGGSVGRLTIVSGRWPSAPDEIAVNRAINDADGARLMPGGPLTVATAAGPRVFRTVGEVGDPMAYTGFGPVQRGWVQPAVAAELSAPAVRGSARHEYLVPYRIAGDVGDSALTAQSEAISRVLPPGAQTQAPLFWSMPKAASNWLSQSFGAVIYAFMVASLLSVVLIVASIVAGAIIATRRELGVGKALGFTPAQVVAAVVLQALVPTAVGGLVGLPLGLAASTWFLSESAEGAGGVPLPAASPVDVPTDLGLYAAMLVLVAVVALAPAVRAARVTAVTALATGPERGDGRSWFAGAVERLRLPRHVQLGIVDASRRPVRSVLTLAAVAVGLAALTLALTLGPALGRMADRRADWGAAQDFNVTRTPQASDDSVTAALAARPEIAATLQAATAPLAVAGHTQSVPLTGMRGDAESFGYRAIRGRWFAAPGEAVVAGGTAKELGLRVGDTLSGTVNGRPLSAQVVGIMNDITTGGLGARVSWATYTGVVPNAQPDLYQVALRPGNAPKAAITTLNEHDGAILQAEPLAWGGYADGFLAILNAFVGGLACAIVLLSAAGVFNVAVLAVMERRRDHAILKAVGMSARQFAAMVFSFGAALTLGAAVIGIPAGLWFEDFLVNTVMGSQWGFELPQGSLDPLTALAIVAGALAVALLGTAIPARRALKVPAAVVLHSE